MSPSQQNNCNCCNVSFTLINAQPPTNEHTLSAHSIHSISRTVSYNLHQQTNPYRLSLNKCCNQICGDSRQTAQSRMPSARLGSSAFVWWLCTRARVQERINALPVNWFNKLIHTYIHTYLHTYERTNTHTQTHAQRSGSHSRRDGSWKWFGLLAI